MPEPSKFTMRVATSPLAGAPLFERALFVAADDPLAARAINYFRASGILPDSFPIRNSEAIPPGCGFMADGQGSGEIIIFEEPEPAHQEE